MRSFILKNIYLLILIISLFPCWLFAYEMDDCISCHSDNPDQGIPQVSAEDFEASIHGSMMECSACHSYIEEGHEAGEVTGEVDCGNCHAQESLHGAGSENQPECYSCHTKHNILPSFIEHSPIHETRIKELCIKCHQDKYGKTGYLNWFTSLRIRSHKKQDFSKKYDETNCSGCHLKIEIHEKIETVTESECARCHMKDNKNAMMGRFHASGNSGSSITGISIITQVLILLVLVFAVHFIIKPLSKSGKGKE